MANPPNLAARELDASDPRKAVCLESDIFRKGSGTKGHLRSLGVGLLYDSTFESVSKL